MRTQLDSTRRIISAKDLATSAVSVQPRAFGLKSSKSNEARVSVTFTSANAPTPIYHGLQHAPSQVIPVAMNQAAMIYTDMPLIADSRTVVVYCDTANTAAELIVR